MDLGLVVAVEELADGDAAAGVRHALLEEGEVVVGVAVDDGDADVVVGVVAVRRLVDGGGARGDDVAAVQALVHRVGLARVDHEQHLAVPALLPHLLEGVGQVPAAQLLGVLELEELLAAVARHVHQHVAAAVAAEPLAARDFRAQPVRQEADEVLDGDFVAAVVDFDVGAVEVELARGVVEDAAREGVARVARHVVGEEEEDLRVRDAEPFDGAVEGEDVGEVAVVEPEAGGGDEDGPVGGVGGGCEGGEEGDEEEEEGVWEAHCCRGWGGTGGCEWRCRGGGRERQVVRWGCGRALPVCLGGE